MSTWTDFTTAEPDLARTVAAKFEAHLHHVVATLRADGSPRVSGTEARFFDGTLYLGSMPGSRKGADLRRDPRLALHAATIDVELKDGDAKIDGRGVEVDRDEADRFLASLGNPAASDGEVFAVHLDRVTLTRVEGEELVIAIWQPGRPVRTVRRS